MKGADSSTRRARGARCAAWGGFAVAAASMVATPLLPKGGRGRAALANAVVGGLAGTALAAAAERWGARRAATAFGAVAAGTLAVERVGTAAGVPFGRYHYTSTLQPQVAGVPVAVPLAWFAMALPARAAAGALTPPAAAARRVATAAALLTAWDLFLDPQMVGEGYWRWARHGRYRGIPATNYAGWLLTSAVLMAGLERLLPVGEQRGEPAVPVAGSADRGLVGVYAFVAVMSTLGFAAFFGDPLVALAGGAAMLPPAALALARVQRG